MTTTMTKRHALNGAFEAARNELARALGELKTAQSALGELINSEAKLEDELASMKPTFRATNPEMVERKTRLTQQATEVRAQSRLIESKTLPRLRENLAMGLTNCVDPYRDELSKEIASDKGRLLRVLKDYCRDEATAVAMAERTDKIAFLLSHLRCSWVHNCTDTNMAQLVLGRMDSALRGGELIQWPPPVQSPG
jgi:hypothetical protein